MAERRTIGQILMSFGRITEDDVERALGYQRENGGYFGEALLGLGLVSQEELEWGLASQFDLPYVFPDADSIDPEAADIVTPEWALAHMTLPIMKTHDALTVIVDSPIKTEAVDLLSARTDLRIELALASASKIRELIRQVYSRKSSEDDEKPVPVELDDFLGLALEAGSGRFGISTRGPRAWAWFEDRGKMKRRPLDGLWHGQLDELLQPSPSEKVEEGAGRAQWDAHLTREGVVSQVQVRYLATPSGSEYLFKPVQERNRLEERFSAPPQGILSEIRLLARSGNARFLFSAEPAGAGDEILPFLPALLLNPTWRSVYLVDRDSPVEGEVFTIRVPSEGEELDSEFGQLRAFHFDVVVADLSGDPADWLAGAIDVASVAFLRWPPDGDPRVAQEAGVRWQIHVRRTEEGTLDWTLDPVG